MNIPHSQNIYGTLTACRRSCVRADIRNMRTILLMSCPTKYQIFISCSADGDRQKKRREKNLYALVISNINIFINVSVDRHHESEFKATRVKVKCSLCRNRTEFCVFCIFVSRKANITFNMYVYSVFTPQETRILLTRIVEQYNFIHAKTEKCEFDIVFDQVEMIDAEAAILVDEFTWQNFGKQ